MPTTKLGVFASLALAASAVLLPPTTTANDLGDDNALETLAIDPFKRSVALDCPGCPFAVFQDKTLTWKEGAGNSFVCSLLCDVTEVDRGVQLRTAQVVHSLK